MIRKKLYRLWQSVFNPRVRQIPIRPSLEALETRLAPAVFTWSGNGPDNHWSDGANWVGGVAPTSSGKTLADLVFGPNAKQTTTSNDLTGATFNSITISATGYTLGGNLLNLGNSTDTTGGYITAGGTGVLTDTITLAINLGDASRSLQYFTVNSNTTLTIIGNISGSSGSQLTKSGVGTLVLTGDNSKFTGNIYVNGGILEAESNTALGSAALSVVTVSSASSTIASQLQLYTSSSTGLTIGNSLILNGTGIIQDGAILNVGGNNTWTGTVTMASATDFGANSGTLTFKNTISDLGSGYSLTKVGGATVVLAAANTYRGVTYVNNGVLEVENALALGTEDGTAATGTVVNYNRANGIGGTLLINDPNAAKDGGGFTIKNEYLDLRSPGTNGYAGFDNLSGANTWAGTVLIDPSLQTGSVYRDPTIGAEIVGDANSLSITGPIVDAIIGNYVPNWTIVKVGVGKVIFTHANTQYVGNTIIQSGILEVTDSQAMGPTSGAGVTIVSSGATLELAVFGGNVIDSVTHSNRSLDISNVIQLSGTGFFNGTTSLGALDSHSGVNVVTGQINFVTPSDTVGINVDPDPNASNSNAYFPTYNPTTGVPLSGDYSLTIQGSINGNNLQTLEKIGTGQLILPGNYNFPGHVDINMGWITVGSTAGFGDTTVDKNASLMLMPMTSFGNLNPGGTVSITQALHLNGIGITDPYLAINQMGALVSLDGADTATGTIYLNGLAGIGVQDLDPASFINTSLTLPGEIEDGTASGGIIKLGTQRLILLDNNTFTNTVEIKTGVLLVRNNAALGSSTVTSQVIVDSGASLELGGTTTGYNGDLTDANGNPLGLQVWDKNLVLSGGGDASLGDFAPLVVEVGDNAWRGNVTLATSTDLDIAPNSRLSIYGVVDDNPNSAPGGSDLVVIDGGELQLWGSNTFRGATYVGTESTIAGTASSIASSTNIDNLIPNVQSLNLSAPVTQTLSVSGTVSQTLTFTGLLVENLVLTQSIYNTTGTVTFTYGSGSTTLPVSTANAVSIQTALNTMIGSVTSGASVSVSSTGTDTYSITFQGNQPVYPLQVIANLGAIASLSWPTTTLNYGTAALVIPLAISASTLQSDLNNLIASVTPGIPPTGGYVKVTSPSAGTFVITYQLSPPAFPITVSSTTTGNTASITTQQMKLSYGTNAITVPVAINASTLQTDLNQLISPLTPGATVSVTETTTTTPTTFTISFEGVQPDFPLQVSTPSGSAITATLPAPTGTITLGYGTGSTTVPLINTTYNLQTSLNTLISGVTPGVSVVVTKTTSGAFAIAFQGAQSLFPATTPLVVSGTTGTITASVTPVPVNFTTDGILTLANSNALGDVVTSQVETLDLSGKKGNFSLSFDGASTAANGLGPTSTANDVETALDNLSTFGGVGGSVDVSQGTASNGDTLFTIIFDGSLAGFAEHLITASATGGLIVTPTIVTSGSGGVVVDNGATMQLLGNITVAQKPLIISGSGQGTVPSSVPTQWFNLGAAPVTGTTVTSPASNAERQNTSGQVTGIAINPNNPSSIYISTAGGGAWRTEDYGKTWMPFELPSDSGTNLAVNFSGAIAVDPNNPSTIYLGTGNPNGNNLVAQNSTYGTGLYKTTDGGKTWTLVTASTGGTANPLFGLTITSIAVDSNDFVYVATSDQNINGPGNGTGNGPVTPGIWRFNGSTWFNLTSVVSAARTGQLSVLSTPTNPVYLPAGPDDDFRISFPQIDATWTNVQIVNGVLYAALGTSNESLTQAFYYGLDPATIAGDNSNGIYRIGNYATATATGSTTPIWYVGSGTTDSDPEGNESSTNPNEFPTAQIQTITISGAAGTIANFYLNNQAFSVTAPTQPITLQQEINSLSSINGVENGAVSVTNTTPPGPQNLVATLQPGGTLTAASVYYYTVVATIPSGTSTTTTNESNIAQVTATSTDESTTLTWAPVPGAISYSVYRTNQVDALGNPSFVTPALLQDANSPNGATTTQPNFYDSGAATVTGAPPAPSQTFNIFFEGKASGMIQQNPISPSTATITFKLSQQQNTNVQLASAIESPQSLDNGSLLAIYGYSPSMMLFAATTTTTGTLHEVRQSPDGGNSWFDIPSGSTTDKDLITPSTNYQGSQGEYSSTILAANVNTIYLGGANTILETNNNGGTWTNITVDGNKNQPTPFLHTMAIDSSGNLIVGGDYGIWAYENGLWNDLNGNLALTQYNSVSVSPSDLTYAVGGTNGNGIVGLPGYPGSPAWSFIAGNIGSTVQIDPNNEEIVYVVYDGILYKSISGVNGPYKSILGDDSLNVITTFEIDPANSQHILAISQQGLLSGLYESTDGGASFRKTDINSGTLVAQAVLQGTFQNDHSFGDVTDVGATTDVYETYYTVSGTTVVVTRDDGNNIAYRNPPLPANSTIEKLIVDPTDSYHLFMVVNTVVNGSITVGSVWESTDGAKSWTNITGSGLPTLPFWTVVFDPRSQTLYLGTDNGVWDLAVGSTTTWQSFGSGMTNAQVMDLQLNQVLNTLTAATFGRSVFTYYLPDFQMFSSGGSLRSVSGTAVWSGSILLNGATTISAAGTQALQNGVATASLNILGSINNAGSSQSNLTKTGDGDVILSGADTYTGLTDVKQGVLVLRNAQALGRGSPGAIVEAGTAINLESDLTDQVPLYLYGNGIQVDGHSTGALHNVTNSINTVNGPVHLMTSSVTIGSDSNTTLNLTGVVDDTATGIDGFPSAVGNAILNKELNGQLDLTAANTYTGNTNVVQGVLNIQNPDALGSNPKAVTHVTDGAQLQLQGGIIVTEGLTLSGTGIDQTGALENYSGNNYWEGQITLTKTPAFLPPSYPGTTVSINVLNAADTLTVGGTSGGTITESASSFNLEKVGAGTLTLAHDDGYTGSTFVDKGKLDIQSSNSLGNPVSSASVVVASGAELDLDTVSPTQFVNEQLMIQGVGAGGNGVVNNIAGSNTWQGNIVLQANSSFNLKATANTALVSSLLTVAGIISEVTPNTSLVLNSNGVDGDGILDLTNSNKFTGTSTVNGGTLEVDGSISGPVQMNGGYLSGTGTVGAVTTSLTASTIIEPGNLIKATNGTLNTGADNWNASTTFYVNLTLTGSNSLSDSGDINLNGANLSGQADPTIPLWTSFTILQTTGSATIIGQFAPQQGQANIAYFGNEKFYVNYVTNSQGAVTSVVLTKIPRFDVALAITSNSNPTDYGQPITLTVTATDLGYTGTIPSNLGFTLPTPPTTLPDGSLITLTFAGQTVTLSLMDDVATYTYTDLPPLNTLNASTIAYEADASYAETPDFNSASAPPFDQLINPAQTVVTLSASETQVVFTDSNTNPLVISVNVSQNETPSIPEVPTGSVTLTFTPVAGYGTQLVTSAQTLDANGNAVFSINSGNGPTLLNLGSYNVTATYTNSDGNFNSNTASLMGTPQSGYIQVIQDVTTDVNLSVNPNVSLLVSNNTPSYSTQDVPVSVTLINTDNAALIPTGTVTFTMTNTADSTDSYSSNPVTLDSNGSANFVFPGSFLTLKNPTVAETFNLTATYSLTQDFVAPSDSGVQDILQTVNPDTLIESITSNETPAYLNPNTQLGDPPPTYTLNLMDKAKPGVTIPTGQVSLTITNESNAATYTTPYVSLANGSAVFSGNNAAPASFYTLAPGTITGSFLVTPNYKLDSAYVAPTGSYDPSFTQVLDSIPTQLSLSSSNLNTLFTNSFQITATVTVPTSVASLVGNPTPTGCVSLQFIPVGSSTPVLTLPMQTLVGGSTVFNVSTYNSATKTTILPEGTYTVIANYVYSTSATAEEVYAPATANLGSNQVVYKYQTALSLTPDSNFSYATYSNIYTISVTNSTNSAIIPTGSVTLTATSITTPSQSPIILTGNLDSNGNAKLALTVPTSGNYSITATYVPALTFDASSNTLSPVTVYPASQRPATLKLSIPTTVINGVTATYINLNNGNHVPTITVTALNSNGVQVPYTGPVTIAINSTNPNGPLQGTTTVNAVNGVATFTTLTLPKAGSYNLIATSWPLSLTSAPSAPVIVYYPGVASQLKAVVENVNQGSFWVVCTACDAVGNTVTNFNGTATISLASSNVQGGALAGQLSAMFVNGVATFTKLNVNKSGIYNFNLFAGSLSTSLNNEQFYIRGR